MTWMTSVFFTHKTFWLVKMWKGWRVSFFRSLSLSQHLALGVIFACFSSLTPWTGTIHWLQCNSVRKEGQFISLSEWKEEEEEEHQLSSSGAAKGKQSWKDAAVDVFREATQPGRKWVSRAGQKLKLLMAGWLFLRVSLGISHGEDEKSVCHTSWCVS